MNLKKFMKTSFNMLAVDQRGSFKSALKEHNPKVNNSLIKSVKKDIIENLSPFAGAVLIDPVYSLKFKDIVKKNSALLFCLESSGFKKVKGGLLTELQKNFSVYKAKQLGADAVKLNICYNPFAYDSVLDHQKKLVKKIGKDCKKYKIDFLLEIIVYPLFCNMAEFTFQKPLLILRSVKEFSKKEYAVDVLKLQFPCDLNYVKTFKNKKNALFSKKDCSNFCRLISEQSRVPWVLLSAGVDMVVFVEQLKIAMKNGCSGFLAGRAVWKNALSFVDDHVRKEWIKSRAVSNIKILNKIAGV